MSKIRIGKKIGYLTDELDEVAANEGGHHE